MGCLLNSLEGAPRFRQKPWPSQPGPLPHLCPPRPLGRSWRPGRLWALGAGPLLLLFCELVKPSLTFQAGLRKPPSPRASQKGLPFPRAPTDPRNLCLQRLWSPSTEQSGSSEKAVPLPGPLCPQSPAQAFLCLKARLSRTAGALLAWGARPWPHPPAGPPGARPQPPTWPVTPRQPLQMNLPPDRAWASLATRVVSQQRRHPEGRKWSRSERQRQARPCPPPRPGVFSSLRNSLRSPSVDVSEHRGGEASPQSRAHTSHQHRPVCPSPTGVH